MPCPATLHPLPQVRFAAAGAVPLLVRLLRAPKDATRRAAASGGWEPLVLCFECEMLLVWWKRAWPGWARSQASGQWLFLLAGPLVSGGPPTVRRHGPPTYISYAPLPAAQPCGTWPTATTPTARRSCGRGQSRPSSACSRWVVAVVGLPPWSAGRVVWGCWAEAGHLSLRRHTVVSLA